LQTGDLIEEINGAPVSSWRGIDEMVDEVKGDALTSQVLRNGERLAFNVAPKHTGAKDIYGDDITNYDLGIKGYAEPSAVVEETVKGMPAEKAGLKKGDRIIAIDGQPIERWEAMQEIVSSSKGRPLVFKILRDGETFETRIEPEEVQEKNVIGVKESAYRIGIRRAGIIIPDEDQITLDIGVWGALTKGLGQTWNVVKATGYFFVKLVERKVPSEAIGGPIRIAQMANQQAEEGFLAWLYFIAIISVNLAVINLVPIPVLDGGHLLFFAIEAVLRKPVSIKMRETAQQIGIFLLLLLMIFVFYNDIMITWFR
jgi:regulator of sigma E protease